MPPRNPLYEVLRAARHRFQPDLIIDLFANASEERVENIAQRLAEYITEYLPIAVERRNGLADYRTNPYVLLTCASVMGLNEPQRFADFLFNSKLYMGLETSFGKSIESILVGQYPLHSENKWEDPAEKIAEFAALEGLSNEDKARRRTASVWREIDKACVLGSRRFMTSIKSGPNTINDTQVQAMTRAIIDNHEMWMQQTKENYPEVENLDIIIGLTYGTDRTTNNKENQIICKLLEHGFEEEDRENHPGVIIDSATHSIRIYRRIGRDFWALIGNPLETGTANWVFLEVLLGLAKALSTGIERANLEESINRKLQALSLALGSLRFPRRSLPEWVREDFSEDELFWFATAMSSFFDEGI